ITCVCSRTHLGGEAEVGIEPARLDVPQTRDSLVPEEMEMAHLPSCCAKVADFNGHVVRHLALHVESPLVDVRLLEVRAHVYGKERIRQRGNFTYQERRINSGWGRHSRLKVDELVGGLDRIVEAIMEAVELGEFEKKPVTRAQDQLIRGSRPPHNPQAGRPVKRAGKHWELAGRPVEPNFFMSSG